MLFIKNRIRIANLFFSVIARAFCPWQSRIRDSRESKWRRGGITTLWTGLPRSARNDKWAELKYSRLDCHGQNALAMTEGRNYNNMNWIATRRESGRRFSYNNIITSSVITVIPHIYHLCVAPFPFSSLRGRLVRGNPGFGNRDSKQRKELQQN